MKLHIRIDHCEREALRTLLIDAADQLAGAGSSLLEAKLPWDGQPILLADASAAPVLVSFDMDDSCAALLHGLRASDRLATALPWVNQVYEALKQAQKSPRLIVVSREPPPGWRTALPDNDALAVFTCQVLRVNEDMAILLEPSDREQRPAAAAGSSTVPAQPTTMRAVESRPPVPPANDGDLPPLSDQEAAYFQQL